MEEGESEEGGDDLSATYYHNRLKVLKERLGVDVQEVKTPKTPHFNHPLDEPEVNIGADCNVRIFCVKTCFINATRIFRLKIRFTKSNDDFFFEIAINYFTPKGHKCYEEN